MIFHFWVAILDFCCDRGRCESACSYGFRQYFVGIWQDAHNLDDGEEIIKQSRGPFIDSF